MASLQPSDASRVSEAIVIWTGWRDTPWPSRDDDRLVKRFGKQLAAELLPIVKQLEREFYDSDADLTARDLREMARTAASRFRELHPELSSDAADALAWCYAYDNK